jgi:hypothetical protein
MEMKQNRELSLPVSANHVYAQPRNIRRVGPGMLRPVSMMFQFVPIRVARLFRHQD